MSPVHGEIRALTGLRAVAAYSVLVAHILSAVAVANTDAMTQAFCERLAYFGISLFFVLSGFVMEYNYVDRIAAGGWRPIFNFFVARFARLYPLYFAVLVYTIWLTGSQLYLDRPDIVLSHLLLAQSWIGSIRAYAPVTWTISTEWFFYIAFVVAACAVVAIRRPLPALIVVTTAGVIGVGVAMMFQARIIAFIITYVPVLLDRGDLSINQADWLEYYSPLTRLPEFFIGVLCGRVYQFKAGKVGALAAVAALGWCVFIIGWGELLPAPFSAMLPNIIYAPALAIILLYCCQGNPLSVIMSFALIQLAGEISYSVYLTQGFIIGRVAQYFTGLGALTLATVLAVTLVSIATWLLIERPSRWALRKLQVAER
jgi:peptidoglycan/LPS O-acetylase OafA/YrhL